MIDTLYEALRRRRPQSATRLRKAMPAEVATRMLVVKHLRNWSFDTLEREVRATWSIGCLRESAPKGARRQNAGSY